MVLCSIEEAWGSDFNQNFKYNPGTSQTYKKKNNQPSKNRYRYNFHRSSEPLPNHNGSYRDQNVFDVTLDNNKPLEEEYQFENQSNSNNNNLTPIEYDNNPNQNKIYNSTQKKLAKKTNNDLVPFYDNDEDENYENFDSQSNNENSDDEFDITKLNRHYDKKKNVDDDNNSDTSNDSDSDDDEKDNERANKRDNDENKNQSSRNIINNSNSELGTVKVNFNLADLNQKFNDLVKVIEKYTMTNGNDMKDIFLFIFLGIFVIFILDLIFRIGQKLKS